MSRHVIVWDLETVPDIAGYAAANGLTGKSDEEIREALGGQALPPSRTGLSPAGPRQLRLAHRYAFTVRDSHPLLLAGLPAHIGLVSD